MADRDANIMEGTHTLQARPVEVFWLASVTDGGPAASSLGPGWFWWPCQPGCLPDGEPNGPFDSSIEAYLDAQGNGGH